jgi:hypothetical protein
LWFLQPEERAERIACPMQAEGESTLLVVNGVRDQRITRRRADAFSNPIRHSDAQHPSPRAGEV